MVYQVVVVGDQPASGPEISSLDLPSFSFHELALYYQVVAHSLVYRNRWKTKNDDDFSRIKVLYLVDSVK